MSTVHKYLNRLSPWQGRGGFTPEPVRKVLKYLGDPQEKIKVVHVAGTNGKGSVSAAVASILGASSYRVGLNSSPHLQRINERIVLDGLSIGDAAIEYYSREVDVAARRIKTELSFHEAITALAFLAFSDLGVDFGVFEVGLGGRLDASNVVEKPLVTAIVSIGLDHTDLLGDTLSQIAYEKAGIVKKGVPLVLGKIPTEALSVISNVAVEKEADLYVWDREFHTTEEGKEPKLIFKHDSIDLTSPLPGKHQHHNMAVAAVIGRLLGCSAQQCEQGIKQVFWPGRCEMFETKVGEVLLDSAHNIDGYLALSEYLQEIEWNSTTMIFGAMSGKDWRAGIKALQPFVNDWILARPKGERGVNSEEIKAHLSCLGIRAEVEEDRSVLNTILLEREKVVVSGSMYLVGEVRELLSPPLKPLWERQVSNP